jgi:hypothetical protein
MQKAHISSPTALKRHHVDSEARLASSALSYEVGGEEEEISPVFMIKGKKACQVTVSRKPSGRLRFDTIPPKVSVTGSDN